MIENQAPAETVNEKTDFSHEYTVSSLPNWSTSVAQSRSGEILSQQRCHVWITSGCTSYWSTWTIDSEAIRIHWWVHRWVAMPLNHSGSWFWWVWSWLWWVVAAVPTSRCATDVDHLGRPFAPLLLYYASIYSAVGCRSFATLAHLHPDVLVKSKVLQHRKHLSLARHPVAQLEHFHSVSQYSLWWRVDAKMHKVLY